MFNSPKNKRPEPQETIYWHDYETSGPVANMDRPYQFAGIRTDLDLNEIQEPNLFYCKPNEDILPHPHACVLTGITPQKAQKEGLCEADFADKILAELSQPFTCGAGYNSLKFDDEVSRHLFYRNFRPVYDREWQNHNSRFDLLGVLRLTYLLRPNALKWFFHEKTPSFKLEDLSIANDCQVGVAHEALSDVRCTIALAKKVKENANDLYEQLFNLRLKDNLIKHVKECMEHKIPMLHASSVYSNENACVGLVTPLFFHPTRPQILIAIDLSRDIDELLNLDEESLFERFSRPLKENEERLPIQMIALNRVPALLSGKWLKGVDLNRFSLDLTKASVRQGTMIKNQDFMERFSRVLLRISQIQENTKMMEDPDLSLYEGFPTPEQTHLISEVRQASPEKLSKIIFDDVKYDALLFRYRARNFFESLNDIEQKTWKMFCKKRLSASLESRLNWEQFEEALLIEEHAGAPLEIIQALKDWMIELKQKCNS